MTDELTPSQALALWGLLARQGRAWEKDIKLADRGALIAARFAQVDKASRTISLTDRGWDWASKHLNAALVEKQPVLSLFLARLGAHLAKSGETLADFIGAAPDLPMVKMKSKKTRSSPPLRVENQPTTNPNAKMTVSVIRKMIESAYLRATGGVRSEPVRLSKLRIELSDLDRKTVDAGLARILKAKKETASLSQIGDNKAIDNTERKAAYESAGEPFHLIRIK